MYHPCICSIHHIFIHVTSRQSFKNYCIRYHVSPFLLLPPYITTINITIYLYIHIWDRRPQRKTKNMCIWRLVEMSLSQKCAKIVNSWGPPYKTWYICVCVICLAMTSTPQEINRGKISVAFRWELRYRAAFSTNLKEDDEVLAFDFAMFCSARLWWVPLAPFTRKARWYFPSDFEPP